MHLALWDIPPVDFLVEGLEAGVVSEPMEIHRQDAQACAAMLLKGQADVALLPSMAVLSHTDAFDVLPGAALSTWKYPYVRLVFPEGLERVETVAYASAYAQEALVARIVLREHYGKDPAFLPLDAPTTEALLGTGPGASLLAGPDAPLVETEHLVLDVGQEWFELVNYPMVWGLFATLKDSATPRMVDLLLQAVRAAEKKRIPWVKTRRMPPGLRRFYRDDLRLRFDDLVTASLTELRQYLYFYHVTEDIPGLPLFERPDYWDDEEGEAPLL